jgi:hypothetical protein
VHGDGENLGPLLDEQAAYYRAGHLHITKRRYAPPAGRESWSWTALPRQWLAPSWASGVTLADMRETGGAGGSR